MEVISRAAGLEPFAECAEILKSLNITSLDNGDCVLTSAGNLSKLNNGIIHAVGPVYSEKQDEKAAKELESAYYSSLQLATGKHLLQNSHVSKKMLETFHPFKTIAFPSISTGLFHYPIEKASKIALKAIERFINDHPDTLDEVIFVFLPLEKDHQKTATFYISALDQ